MRARQSKDSNIHAIDKVIPTQNAKPAQGVPVLPAAPVSEIEPVEDRSRTRVAFGPTPLAAAFRFVEPTWRNYIMYVDMESRTGNADAARYLRTWQALTYKERQAHVPEQLCELANVPAADLIAWVTRQAWVESSAKTSLVLSFMKDRVVEKTAEFAMASPDNIKHAELFSRQAGLVQTPGVGGRGSGTTIYNVPVASSGAVALAGSRSESSPVNASGLKSMDQEIVDLSAIMQRQDAPVAARAEALVDEPDDDDDESEEGDE